MTRPLDEFKPLRIIVRPTADGSWEGLVEHSFSLDWSRTHVNMFWSGKAYSILGETKIDSVEWAHDNMTRKTSEYSEVRVPINDGRACFDPEDPACPIEVNLAYWHESWAKRGKFDCRNAPFKVRL